MPREVQREVDAANAKSAQELARIARVLHPGKGEHKADITVTPQDDGHLVDFGAKAKVTEGDRGPRAFVNPALKVSRKRHRNRAKRAMKKAVARVFTGG
ncbi:hypothetical protein [Pseudoroseicyclus aestuarii]|nr:hypothetical protein [Pseudoroseicyclus aestuarii]